MEREAGEEGAGDAAVVRDSLCASLDAGAVTATAQRDAIQGDVDVHGVLHRTRSLMWRWTAQKKMIMNMRSRYYGHGA